MGAEACSIDEACLVLENSRGFPVAWRAGAWRRSRECPLFSCPPAVGLRIRSNRTPPLKKRRRSMDRPIEELDGSDQNGLKRTCQTTLRCDPLIELSCLASFDCNYLQIISQMNDRGRNHQYQHDGIIEQIQCQCEMHIIWVI